MTTTWRKKGFGISVIILLGGFFLSHTASATYGDTSTFAGKSYDGDDGPATAAILDFPDDLGYDSAGNLFIADTYDNAVRKITPEGIISTFAGGSYGASDGTGSAAHFGLPKGLALDASDNVYVADTGNNTIRKITAAGVVTTLVSSGLSAPTGLAIAGSTLFIADTGNNMLKSVSTSGGTVQTITASLNTPRKIAASSDGSMVYVADMDSHRVLAVAPATGTVSVIAGSGEKAYLEGIGTGASFEYVLGVALSEDQSSLFVADVDQYLTDRIRTINLATGQTAIFSVDHQQAEMLSPSGMAARNGLLTVAMSGGGFVRQYSIADPTVHPIIAGSDRFGSREGTDPIFGRPHDLALTNDRSTLYIAENNRIRKVTIATKTSSYVTGSYVDNYRDGLPVGVAATTADEARFSTIPGIVVTADAKSLYVVDRWNNRIRKINVGDSIPTVSLVTGAGRINSTGETTNVYQEGTKCTQVVDRNETLAPQSGCAYFLGPTSLVLDPTEKYLYVADTGNNRIRKVRIADGVTTLIAGSSAGFADGTGSEAKFNTPLGVALNDVGTMLYVADRNNHRIRVIDLATNAVTTLAGAGTAGYQEGIGASAFFSYPLSLKMGADGKLYLGEAGSHRIRQIDPATGLTKLVSGSGIKGLLNGTKTEAQYNGIEGIALDTNGGKAYVADSMNDLIREIAINGPAPYANPAPTLSAADPRVVSRTWAKGGATLRIKVRGTGFRYGATTTFGTIPAIKTYVISSTLVVVSLPLASMKAGWYDITVRNTDGQSGYLETAFGLGDFSTAVPSVYFQSGRAVGFAAFPKTFRGGVAITTGNVWGDGRDEIIVAPGDGFAPQVRVFSQDGILRSQFFAYDRTTTSGVRMASCDINNDGFNEIVTVPGRGARPLVKIMNDHGVEVLPNFYALDGKFLGGANLACGDINGDGTAEIIVGAGRGGGPQLTIHGAHGRVYANFFAYDKKFRAGIVVGLADLDGNGTPEIVTGPEAGAPHVQLFDGKGRRLSPGFFVFSRTFNGGISVAGGDTNHDGKDEIILAPAKNAEANVKVMNPLGTILFSRFFAYPWSYTGGVRLSVGDINGDSIDDIVTAPVGSYGASVRMFTQDGKPLNE